MITYSHNSNCITPQMTAADAPSPVVITESSSYNSDFASWHIFDQVVDSVSLWSANERTFPQWIKIYLGSVGSSIIGYTLSARGDAEYYMTTPSEWKLYGSVDDINWIELDHQIGITGWLNSEMRAFSLGAETTSYNYFKFEVLDSEGVYAPAIGELELIKSSSMNEIIVYQESEHQFTIGGSDWEEGYGSFGLYGESNPYGFVMIFGTLAIPAGATIVSAVVQFQALGNYSGENCHVNIYFNDVGDAVHPIGNGSAEELVLTAAVAYDPPPFSTAQLYNSPDLAIILQTIIDRPDWASGNKVQLVVRNNESPYGGYRVAYDWGPGNHKLTINYTEGAAEFTGNLVSSLGGISSEFTLEQITESEFTGNLVSSLEGISSEFILGQDEFFSKIKIEFSLVKKTFDDIPFICEWQKMSWESIACEFSFKNYDYYQYAYIAVLFQIIQGSYFSDVPVIFSVIRKLQSFAFYIMQKLYCTCAEINGGIGVDLEDWNVSPNKTWFVHVNNDLVTLYNTEADMIAGINAIMYGYADSTTFKVVLLHVDDESIVDFYYQDLIYHLSLTAIGAPNRYFRVKPLTDLAEIRHPIYNNSNIVLSRGEAELNLHTYAILGKELVLATHIPELESGDSIEYNSVVRGTIKKTQILSHTISGEQSDDGTAILINTIRVAEYKELTR